MNKLRNYKNDGYLLALDLGTSTIKVALYSTRLEEIAFKSSEYRLSYPAQDLVENDVDGYWNIIKTLIRSLLKDTNCNSDSILALSISSQGETIIPVDLNIEPVRPAIVWLDGRSKKEADQIAKDFDIDELYKITGMPFSDPSWPAARIKWFKKKEPENYRRTYKFLLLEDYIVYKLTGKIIGESTVYNTSYYYDINKLDFYLPMLDYLEISKSMLPEVCLPGEVIGNVSKNASSETGLSTRTKYVSGAMDQIAGALGAGNIKEGMVTETTGTAFAMAVTSDKPLIDLKNRIPCQLHIEKNKYCLLPYSMTGGMVLKWFKDAFYFSSEKQSDDSNTYNLMTKDAERIKPGCEGLIMLPYLSGANMPENNPRAKGVFFGVSLNHNRSYFIRAILESVGYMLRNNIESFKESGILIEKIISLGGGAKSSLWCQIKSDITGIEIYKPQYLETAILGAAMLAAKGIGIFSDFESIVNEKVGSDEVFRPNADNRKVYDKSFAKYKELYKVLEEIF